MPKVKPFKRDPRETEILKEIGGALKALGISQGELAKRSGIAPQTMSDRMKNIGNMRLWELWSVRDVIKGMER